MTCLRCRQARKAVRRVEQGPWLKDCSHLDCGKPYLAEKKSRRFCSAECFLSHHRAQERLRDAERRKRRQEERPVPALLWRGDVDVNALIAGPPQRTTQVPLRTDQFNYMAHPEGVYCIRCPFCGWLAQGLDDVETTHTWGCFNCYTKISLIDAPTQHPDPYHRVEADT